MGRKDLTGQRFGRLTVIEFSHMDNRKSMWKCICDCGNETIARSDCLLGGVTQSCGCYRTERNRVDLSGMRFGRLVVVGGPESKGGLLYWECRCDCGKSISALGSNLRRGNTSSCGCLRSDIPREIHTKHGHYGTPLYRVWNGMKQRCNNTSATNYCNYGARGIAVCVEWDDFVSFYDWAVSSGYRVGLTIERKDNDKGYSPDNCCWATNKEQQNNKRTNRRITLSGETLTLSQWSERLGISSYTIAYRLDKMKLPVEEALR